MNKRKKFLFILFFLSIMLIIFSDSYISFAKKPADIIINVNNEKYEYYLPEKKFATFESEYIYNMYGRGKNSDQIKSGIKYLTNHNISTYMATCYMYPKLYELIELLDKKIYTKAQNATFNFTPNNKEVFTYKKEITGKKLDKHQLCLKIIENIGNKQIIIDAPIIIDQPSITLNKLKEKTSYRGGATTNIANSSEDRKANVKKALENFNGKIVDPNEEISFNNIVGPRTEENGYKSAKIILDGEYTDGIGGGVCQSSTTIYNAILKSGLEVLQSRKHSQLVGYINPGLDAMVSYGSSDLIWKNNTNSQIYLVVKNTDKTVSLRVYGEKIPDEIKYELLSEINEYISPKEDEIIFDDTRSVSYSEYEKTPLDGVVASSYLVTKKDNIIIDKKWLRTDKYPARQGVKIQGTIEEVDKEELYKKQKEEYYKYVKQRKRKSFFNL